MGTDDFTHGDDDGQESGWWGERTRGQKVMLGITAVVVVVGILANLGGDAEAGPAPTTTTTAEAATTQVIAAPATTEAPPTTRSSSPSTSTTSTSAPTRAPS